MAETDARDATLALLAARAPDASVCPSEVARALATASSIDGRKTDWRDMMPTVHSAIDQLMIDGHLRLSWKGQALESRAGPYRIRRPLQA
ncbi:DUF3253 domain-containing protein [Sphingomonas faeni]|uniref:DUF3253 domain-containing protein n=1 Tax=Sphingomonas faeni TaxID=185950 RepID=UPI00334E6B1B